MVVMPLLIAVVTVLQKEPPSKDPLADAAEQAAAEVELCIQDPQFYFGEVQPGDDVRALCEEANPPEFFVDTWSRLDLVTEREENSGVGVAVVVGLLALLVGTTFVGHDWNTGSMANQLLFVPRRLRVWSAKAVAVAAACLVAAAVGTTAFWLVLASRYWTSDVAIGSGVLLDCLQQGWRAAGVAAGAGVLGYAITMLSRSTVFTLGLLFGVSVAGGLVISLFFDDPGWVDPALNVSAVLNDGTTYYVEVSESCFEATPAETEGCDGERRRSLGQGLVYLGLLEAAVVTGSTLSFRRRDVP